MSATAWRGFFLTKPCFSQQVFYGNRRLAGGANYCQRSEASRTMQSAWQPQSELDARIGRYGQTIKHSQASSPRTSHTRLIKAWTKRVRGQVRALERGPTRMLHRRCTERT